MTTKRRGTNGDLSTIEGFDAAYKGAEHYLLQDDIPDFQERIKQAERWYELLTKNQKGKGLTGKEFEEFKTLGDSLYLEDV